MLFNSTLFLVFFAIGMVVYFAIPHRFRWVLLDKIVDKLSLIPVVEEVMIKRRPMEIHSFDLISSIN
jgi:uncharacterized protein YqhQ